jgi:hypothetical protein
MTAHRFIAPGALGDLAAPVGGATGLTRRCRGCQQPILIFTVVFAAWLSAALAEPVTLDSGLQVTWHDVIAEPPTWRMRYVAPDLVRDGRVYADVADDMQRLCDGDALQRVTAFGEAPQRVVITLMSQPVEFGVMTPDVRQFFESYRVENGLCIWEAF